MTTNSAPNYSAASSDDGDTSHVQSTNANELEDLYALTNPGLSGTVNSVTVFFKARREDASYTVQESARTLLRTNSTNYESDRNTLATTYGTFSTTYTTNPFTGLAWTWPEIDALEAGVKMRKANSGAGNRYSRATQVWVEVDYTPAGGVDPVANNDNATVGEDSGANTINVRGNDMNAGSATIASVTQPTNGSVVITNAGAELTYAPNADYCNDGTPTDNFTYTLSPGGSTATVYITVTCVDDPPVAVDDDKTVTEDDPATTIDVLGNDTDIDGGPISIASVTQPANGAVSITHTGANLTYTPNADYCNGGSPTDNFTYTLSPGGSTATVYVTVTCVNDEPDFTVANPSVDEDTGPHTNVAVTASFDPGASNESGQTVIACNLTNFSDPNTPTVISSTPSASVNATNDGCVISFDTTPNNYGGGITFDLQIQDSGGTANGGDDLSPVKQVTITVNAVDDAPYIESITADQTVQYSDDIDTITVLVRDVDTAFGDLDLARSDPDSAVDGDVVKSTPCRDWDSGSTGSGGECTWTLDGQVLVPGDNDYEIDFTPSDATGDGDPATYTLTVVPEEAVVHLGQKDGDANPVAVEVVDSDTDPTNQAFTMYFWAFEMNSNPFGDEPDEGNANAVEDDFNHGKVKGAITFSGVGPGPGYAMDCTPTNTLSDGGVYSAYSDYMVFRCDIPAGALGVNTYEVAAVVDGDSSATRYFYGFDQDAFVVYDPNAGFTTAGGWFYWPDTDLEEGAQYLPPGGVEGEDEIDHPCAPYAGDKTNFGYTMKYNRKGAKVQGSALVMRHTMVPMEIEPETWVCLEGENYRVKSNALYGLAIASADYYGFASFTGKAVYREPGMDDEGNHTFVIYAEDHGEQGCDQVASDRFWIEVKDKDGVPVMSPLMESPAYNNAVPVECGNVVVPH